ncbi:hypothetical protein TorRG33x02_291820 [Trema orientale]|uniref:Uncharacterized protein n=1 Tax=Trema orientale TaxID=63057 RepID=A0A2P5CAQ9_TREOI|nr:hypothetical protein TorRG33x02_291820 [Trema orientale]
MEVKEDKDLGLVEETGKLRKKYHNVQSKKEKLCLVRYVPSSSLSSKTDEEDQSSLNRIGQVI